MKGRPKSVVISRKRIPKNISSTYNNQPTSSLSRRSVISPHYKKTSALQTEKSKDTKNSVSPTFHSVIGDPDLERLRTSIERGGTFEKIDDNQLKLLLAHTREYQQTCAAERKYEKANDAKELTEKIKEEINLRKEKFRPDEEAIEKAKNEKKKKIDQFNEKFKEFDEETERFQQIIKDKQNTETEKFEDIWRTLNPKKYQKSSSTLLQMKEIEKNLILTGEYLQAKEAHKRIIKATNIEIEQRQIDLNEDYANAKEVLKKKQENQIKVFQQKVNEHIETEKIKRDREMKIIENRMNVVNQKTIGTRCPRSNNKSSTDNYATSFQHIAKEKNFGIDPLLPKLNPPSDKRQYRIKASKKKDIIVNAPRAYLPKNDKYFDSDDQSSVFETSVNQNQLKGASDDNDYDNGGEEQKDILQSQIDEISKSITDYENNHENDVKVEDKSEENDVKVEDKSEENETKGPLDNIFPGISGTLINDDKEKEKEKEEKQDEAVVPRSFTDLVASIVSST